MLVVREASSFVPEIGTADTSGKQRSTECSHVVTRAKNRSDLLNLCRALWFFHAMKERKRKTCKRAQIQSLKGKNCDKILTPSGVPPRPPKTGGQYRAGRPCPYSSTPCNFVAVAPKTGGQYRAGRPCPYGNPLRDIVALVARPPKTGGQ